MVRMVIIRCRVLHCMVLVRIGSFLFETIGLLSIAKLWNDEKQELIALHITA